MTESGASDVTADWEKVTNQAYRFYMTNENLLQNNVIFCDIFIKTAQIAILSIVTLVIIMNIVNCIYIASTNLEIIF